MNRALAEIKKRFQKTVSQFMNSVLLAAGKGQKGGRCLSDNFLNLESPPLLRTTFYHSGRWGGRVISSLIEGVTKLGPLKQILAQGHVASNGGLSHLQFLSTILCVLNISLAVLFSWASCHCSVTLSEPLATGSPFGSLSCIVNQTFADPVPLLADNLSRKETSSQLSRLSLLGYRAPSGPAWWPQDPSHI